MSLLIGTILACRVLHHDRDINWVVQRVIVIVLRLWLLFKDIFEGRFWLVDAVLFENIAFFCSFRLISYYISVSVVVRCERISWLVVTSKLECRGHWAFKTGGSAKAFKVDAFTLLLSIARSDTAAGRDVNRPGWALIRLVHHWQLWFSSILRRSLRSIRSIRHVDPVDVFLP